MCVCVCVCVCVYKVYKSSSTLTAQSSFTKQATEWENIYMLFFGGNNLFHIFMLLKVYFIWGKLSKTILIIYRIYWYNLSLVEEIKFLAKNVVSYILSLLTLMPTVVAYQIFGIIMGYIYLWLYHMKKVFHTGALLGLGEIRGLAPPPPHC